MAEINANLYPNKLQHTGPLLPYSSKKYEASDPCDSRLLISQGIYSGVIHCATGLKQPTLPPIQMSNLPFLSEKQLLINTRHLDCNLQNAKHK